MNGDESAYAVSLELARQNSLRAFTTVMEGAGEYAQPRVAGPLAGMPYAVKDNIDTVALPTSANTPALVGSRRLTNHPAVDRLHAAGALLVGKTNLHELAFGITTNDAAFPGTLNPFDHSRSPGGSSGGSAAAVGSGVVRFALATDTGGSATIPAAWCGVYGYRPTLGRWPTGFAAPLSASRDTVGVIADSLELVRQVDEVVRESGGGISVGDRDGGGGARPSGESIRLGVPAPNTQFVAQLGKDVREVWEAAIHCLGETAGVELVTVDTDQLSELDADCGIAIVLYETQRDLTAYLAGLPDPVSYEQVMEQAASVDVPGLLGAALAQRDSADGYADMMAVRERLRAAWDALFAEYRIDALIRPTVPITAVPIGDDLTTHAFGEEVPTFGTVIRNTGPGSLAGQPNVTIPAGVGSAGLPVGLAVEGGRGDDARLFDVAVVVDGAIGVRSPLLP